MNTFLAVGSELIGGLRKEYRVPAEVGEVGHALRRHLVVRVRRVPFEIDDQAIEGNVERSKLVQRVLDIGAIGPSITGLDITQRPTRWYG